MDMHLLERVFHQARGLEPEPLRALLQPLGPEERSTVERWLAVDAGLVPTTVLGSEGHGLLGHERQELLPVLFGGDGPDDSPRPPRIAGFRAVARLGVGGMGEVWEAIDESLDRAVALKLLPEGALGGRAVELFEREARAGARLSHPGIVTVHRHGQHGGRHWIAMELVRGGRNLRDWIRARSELDILPPGHDEQVAHVIRSIAVALGVAHRAQVVHCDVKPANVLLTEDGSPRVSDFGIARILDDGLATRSGALRGTLAYMSPEQSSRRWGELDGRTDVFSLGVVLFEMLTLQRPFNGDTPEQITEAIQTLDPPDVRRLRSRIPADLASITARCLEKSPRQRFGTMEDLAADLGRFLDHEPILTHPPSMLQRGAKACRRHPVLASSGAVGLTALIVISWLLVLARDLAQTNGELAFEFAMLASPELASRAASEELWPALPETLHALSSWEADRAAVLGHIAAGETSISVGIEALRALRPAVGGQRLPVAPEEHPRWSDLQQLQARRASQQWAQDARQGHDQEPPPPLTDADAPPAVDAGSLAALARSLVDPNRATWGREHVGLAWARQALDKARTDKERLAAGKAIAMAQLSLGQDLLALEAASRIADGVPAADLLDAQEFGHHIAELVAHARSEAGLEAGRRSIVRLDAEIATLAREIEEPRWSSEHEATRQAHAKIRSAILELEHLRDGILGPWEGDAQRPIYGWSIERRIRAARTIEEHTVSGADARRRWSDAATAVAQHPAYQALALVPQLGLLPIGPDPASGLWEFWHVLSGSEPTRQDDGSLLITAETGIVLVLVPGGRTTIGAQPVDPEMPHYLRAAETREYPVHFPELDPYFLSKYELTQGQWLRVAGDNPAFIQPGQDSGQRRTSLLHPVESVSREDSQRILRRYNLVLPTEAQWEHAARAGHPGPTGFEGQVLDWSRIGNIADPRFSRYTGQRGHSGPEDGYVAHAPVGSHLPNGFGFFDMLGNVYEQCADPFLHYSTPVRPGDGARQWSGRASAYVVRGLAFTTEPQSVRVSYRGNQPPGVGYQYVGVRPARALDTTAP